MNEALRPLVITDLDDTLFTNVNNVPETERASCSEVVTDTGGRVSVMTPRQSNFFAWINATCDVVPVTARSLEAFRKIDLPIGNGWKIAGNGAVVITPENVIDDEWAALMRNELHEFSSVLQHMHDMAADFIRETGIEVTVKRYAEHGHEHCVLFSALGDSADHEHLAVVSQSLRLAQTYDIHIHHNRGTLAVTAGPVSKRRAVEYVLARIPDIAKRPIMGFGDSLTDLPFMALADFVCAPTNSQISSKTLAGIYH